MEASRWCWERAEDEPERERVSDRSSEFPGGIVAAPARPQPDPHRRTDRPRLSRRRREPPGSLLQESPEPLRHLLRRVLRWYIAILFSVDRICPPGLSSSGFARRTIRSLDDYLRISLVLSRYTVLDETAIFADKTLSEPLKRRRAKTAKSWFNLVPFGLFGFLKKINFHWLIFIYLFYVLILIYAIVSVKLGRLSVGSAKVSRNGIDDLLSSTDGGKHDYDWSVFN